MKRFLPLLLLLFPFYAQAQPTNLTVSATVPPPVQANASWHGAFGQSPIYYYVCTRYVAGSVCQFSPAVATQTAGIAALGGGNSVTISWSGAPRATGYDVMRFASPGFSGQCSACAIALNTPGTSYTDASAGAGSNYPPAGVVPVVPATGTIRLDNQDFTSPGLLWDSNGVYPFALLPLGFTSGDCAQLSAQPPFLSDSGFPCGSGGSGINQLHGDGTAGPGTGNQLFTLATVNSGSGACGDATHVCRVTTNGKGLVTAQTATSITFPSGGITAITGDVAASGSGSVTGTVQGIESVPFCTGFSPTEGQAVEWTALSTPNPCYTAATPSGGSLNFHGTPTTTAIVTDYDSSHVQTPNATSTLDSAGNLAAAGNVAAGGNLSSGVGTGTASAIHITDTGAVHDQTWNGPGSGYSGTIEYPAAGPTSGQVLTCVTAAGSDCPLSWQTPSAGGITQLTGDVTAGPGSGAQSSAIKSSVGLTGTPTAPTPPFSANNTDIATTNFVRVLLGALNPAVSVQAATTGVLTLAPAYLNGSSGVGATLTATSFGALVVDSYTVLLGNRVLVNNQAADLQNGVYTLTTLGTGGVDYVLTRTSDFNTVGAINNAGVIPVINGTVNAGTDWALAASISAIGVSAINYVQTGSAPPITAVTSVAAGAGLSASPSPIVATGTISCQTATASQIGCSEPDNSTIKATAGVYAAQALTINGASVSPGGSANANYTTGTFTSGDAATFTGTGNQIQDAGGAPVLRIASGTATMGTGAILSGTCASAVTMTATGTATTDVITATVNADPTSTTGYAPLSTGSLYIWSYPTSGNVNFKVCNNTLSTITPSAITLNWRVTR